MRYRELLEEPHLSCLLLASIVSLLLFLEKNVLDPTSNLLLRHIFLKQQLLECEGLLRLYVRLVLEFKLVPQ